MNQNPEIKGWLARLLWHKSDTQETLEQKVYLVKNGMIASILITITFTFVFFYCSFKLLLLISPILLTIVITDSLLIIIKQGIKWFLYFYYSGYIVVCTIVVLLLGGLQYSSGAWGGAFIVFMHTLALKQKRIVIINACVYLFCLITIVICFPYLTPSKHLTPTNSNLIFTISEVWMCLFIVKSFYDSIILRTSEAKKRAAHLQELDQLKSKLYANIAHEFRTPLTLIRGNAEEIEETQGIDVKEKTGIIIQHSNKILFLVNQMLNLSKVEEGRIVVHFVQSDLVAFVRFVVGNFQGFADLRKIRLLFEPQNSELIMDIDTEKLEESLSNLISNAIKYTPEGGEVRVSACELKPVNGSGRRVEITVKDSGIGIPEAHLDKIFIRFYRVEDKRYPYQEGTGIGLTLVNEYMKLMNGSVRVSSIPGKGSEFVLTLPVTNNAESEEIVPVKRQVANHSPVIESMVEGVELNGSRPRLLIIEDNQELIEYLFRLLKEEYQIITAKNGTEGVELAKNQIPDIILSDVMMPGKDGYQVCRELKNDFRVNHIPIVLLTARADTDSRIMGLEHGADAYLTKPFNKQELKICLHNHLVQRETLRLKYNAGIFEQNTSENEQSLNGKFLSRVVEHLEKNYKNDRYGLHDLYSAIGISRVQLHRKLSAITGQSASAFIRSFRLQKARKLLVETNKQVSDIAYEVGFGDSNYFTQLFIRELGISPTELRKSFS